METRTLVRIALMTALIGALGLVPPVFLPFTMGVPITAQSMGVMLAGLLLGARNGALSIALFLLVLALGVPLLSGGRGGLGVFFAPASGYLLGYLPGAFTAGLLVRALPLPPFLAALAAAIAGGIVVVHTFGVLGLAFIAHMDLQKALLVTLAFVPGDLVKAVCAAAVAVAAYRARPALKPRRP